MIDYIHISIAIISTLPILAHDIFGFFDSKAGSILEECAELMMGLSMVLFFVSQWKVKEAPQNKFFKMVSYEFLLLGALGLLFFQFRPDVCARLYQTFH